MNPIKKVRLSKSVVGMEESQELTRIIKEGFLGMGTEVRQFESEIKTYLKTESEVICVNTGTSALHLAVACLDIGPGDEVLVPSITYIASFQAVSATGATPVACDVNYGQGFIDLLDAEGRITPKTKAIMPVHYASNSRDVDAVYRLAEKYGIRVIEDAAQAFGCNRNGLKVGAIGDVICFSFDGIKNITSGEGGAVVTADPVLAKRVKDARLLGVEQDTERRYQGDRSWSFNVENQGYRYHMSNLMAAIGRVQLKKINLFSEYRKNCVERYLSCLKNINCVTMLDLDYDSIISHIFVVRINNGRRSELIKKFIENNIEYGIHYQPAHLLGYFGLGYNLPVSEDLGKELITLPLHADLSECDQKRVIDVLVDFEESCLNA